MSRWITTFLGIASTMLAIAFASYALIPVVGILIGVSEVESFNWLSSVESPRIRELLLRSGWIAAASGLLASVFGGLLVAGLRRVGAGARVFLAGALLMLHLISPYLLAQATISLLGDSGLLWTLLETKPWFSIFSVSGVIAIGALWLTPLGMLVQLMSKGLPTSYREELRALQVSWWKCFRFHWLPASGRSFVLSYGICALVIFWNYDLASMLRVNVFPIELMAAFGSFYDYGMAVSLACIPVLLSVMLIALIFWMCVRQQWTFQLVDRRECTPEREGSPVLYVIGLTIVLIYSLIVYGLWSQIGGFGAFSQFMAEYEMELQNTLRFGLVSSLLVVVLSFFLMVFGRLSRGRGWQVIVVGTLLSWLLPPVLLAMGWVSLWNVPVIGAARAFGVEMYLIGVHAVIVLIPALALLASSVWSPSHNEALDSTHSALYLRILLFWNRQRGVFAVLALSGFALVARDVSAGLLNMPPGGATLAISIETLLHFEQPDRVAALCLAYLLTVVGVTAIFSLLGCGLDSVVKYLLGRRLRV